MSKLNPAPEPVQSEPDQWFYLYDSQTGELISETSVDPGANLPAGLAAIPSPSRLDPAAQKWDISTKAIIVADAPQPTEKESAIASLIALEPKAWTPVETNTALQLLLQSLRGRIR